MAERREYSGAARAAAQSANINNSVLTVSADDLTGWPTGSIGPFVVTLDRGTASEEKVLAESRSGNILTLRGRGYDGTTPVSHSAGSTIEHTMSAVDLDEANAAAVAIGAAWVAWTPTITGWTAGAGTAVARYRRVGKCIEFAIRIVGGAGTTGSITTISLPVNAASTIFSGPVMIDWGSGFKRVGAWSLDAVGALTPVALPVSAEVAIATPIAMANGRTTHISGTYEIA